MGLFQKLASLGTEPNKVIDVQFDSTYLDQISNISASRAQLNLTFPGDLLQEIADAIENHQATARIPYVEEMQFLDVVGESFHQDALMDLDINFPEEWFAGFLVPEPFNQFDKNAVMVLLIKPDDLSVLQVGHLSKEQAKKVHNKICKLLVNDQYVPVLMKIKGGDDEKPNFGVLARAKTNKITF